MAVEVDQVKENIEDLKKRIQENVENLETLEIFGDDPVNIHLAHNTEKSDNIPELVSFLGSINPDLEPEEGVRESLCKSEFIYGHQKYTFNRVTAIMEDYISVIMISRDPINNHKRGLVLIVDASGIIIIATCNAEALRKFNLDLMSTVYP